MNLKIAAIEVFGEKKQKLLRRLYNTRTKKASRYDETFDLLTRHELFLKSIRDGNGHIL